MSATRSVHLKSELQRITLFNCTVHFEITECPLCGNSYQLFCYVYYDYGIAHHRDCYASLTCVIVSVDIQQREDRTAVF